jgi:phenylpropionate dioxygenase-like ring-hydroxylating dioxygenase large terminal subunit
MTVPVIHNEHPALRAAWHPVATSDEVTDEPVRVMLLGEPWVVVRTPELVAFPDRCPHRAAPLSKGWLSDGSLVCPYHGWAFDPAGQLVDVPALGRTAPPRCQLRAPAGLCERYGLVWLAPDDPIAPLPEIPEWDAPGFTVVPLPVRRSSAGVGAITDNFLDLAHFAYLHTGTFSTEDPGVEGYRTEREGWTVRYSIEAPWAHPDGTLDTSTQIYEVTVPFALRLRMEMAATGSVKTIVFFAQPESRTSSRLYKVLVYDDLGEADDALVAESTEFELKVLDEDLEIMESLPDDTLPLAPDAEEHTRADRGGLAWRRALLDLVEQVGVA